MRIVGAQHRLLAPVGFEQSCLGVEVGRHVAVMVQVVPAQVGEDRHPEVDAVDPVLIEGVGRHLHRHRPAALGQKRPEEVLELGGFGRGPNPGESSDHAAVPPGPVEYGGKEVGGGRLAVGSGDPDHVEGRRWVTGQDRRDRPHHPANVGHHQFGNSQPQPTLDQQGRGAGRHRRRRVVVSVVETPRDAAEQVAGLHLARVMSGGAQIQLRRRRVTQAFDLQTRRGGKVLEGAQQCVQSHLVSLSSWRSRCPRPRPGSSGRWS